MERQRVVTNVTGRLMLLFVEMEGWDCWLLPNEAVELRAEVDSPADDFELQDTPEGITVWPSRGMGVITVWQGDREVEIGHRRPDGWP
ncbi:hypothetical protein GC170_06655 [bacterium]|nr:hypothetical protein [bacterium]